MNERFNVDQRRAAFLAMIGKPEDIGGGALRLGRHWVIAGTEYRKPNSPGIVEIFLRKGLGFTNRQIADEFGLSEQTIKNECYNKRKALGLKSTIAVIAIMVSRGLITQEQLTEDLDISESRYATLTDAEKKLLKALAEIQDVNSNRELARRLNVASATAKNRMSSVLDKLGVEKRIRAAVFELFRSKAEEAKTQSLGEVDDASLAVSGNTPS